MIFQAHSNAANPLVPPVSVVPPLAPLPNGAHSAPPSKRFGEPLKWLPVAYVVGMLMYLYYVYVFYHCIPKLQLGEENADFIDQAEQQRGRAECAIFHLLFALLLICYIRSILQHPGSIPDGDPTWEYQGVPAVTSPSAVSNAAMNAGEVKKSGERRHCKWCGKYKPDRCHHCRVCRICILKMDHHCPWIYNCVGLANYKYFILLLVYCCLTANFMVWTMSDTVSTTLSDKSASMSTMFIVLFGETLGGFMAVLTTLFLAFHVWLSSKAMTTIEFCEKSLPKKGKEVNAKGVSRYDLGWYRNVCNTLGENPVLWFLPISPPPGDGITYATNEPKGNISHSPLLADQSRSAAGDVERPYEKTTRANASSVSKPFWSIEAS